MSCPDADAIMLRIQKHEHLNAEWKLELVETIKDYVPECNHYWDKYRDNFVGMVQTEGRVNPKLYGYQSKDSKKK